ncbi:DUF1127 domain-containing protein [Pontivivens ytuae]|uniref:DUF1127 domain-containing protein n=1 Tax=Pontivivens ytuae TaxID=2789856 RepID=A0A7S9LRM5_9RHOB|nr:DUF1127 domain-containing protein [Pontivivens ytuae]QPH54029.1 DUF1127 domain-containing protein [Pontivivens ytuae]
MALDILRRRWRARRTRALLLELNAHMRRDIGLNCGCARSPRACDDSGR